MTDETEKLTALERRTEIAQLMVEKGFKVNKGDLAKKYGVSPSQISQDIRTDDYYRALDDLHDGWHEQINHNARMLLDLAIKQGYRALSKIMPFESKGNKNDFFDYTKALDKVIDRGLQAMQFKLSTGDPRFSSKLEVGLRVFKSPADGLDDHLQTIIDEAMQDQRFLAELPELPEPGDNGGKGNGSE